MAICYDKLWKLLIDKKMNRTELKEASGISFNVLARLGKNEPVSFESIEKICFTLNCKIEDVVEIQKDEPIQIDSDAFTTIELFAGAGGLALGIEKAGFEPLGLIEFDKDAAESLKTNRPNWRVIHDDIANISCLDLEDYFGIKKGDLDLLSGGAPCQAFSYAGKRLGLEDARGTLFYHYATFLQKLQPKMFLFENVRGLLTHDKGRTYATITNIFEQAGYTIQKKVLNAWDFGVPQKRERLITVGIRNDLVGKVSFSFPKEHDYKPVLRDVLLDCPEGPGVPYGENKRKIFELVPPGGYWRDIDPEIRKKENITLYDMDSFRTSETPKELADNLEAAGKIVKEQMEEFSQWLDGRDIIPRIQEIKADAVEDLNLRIEKIFRKTPMEDSDRENLKKAVDTAAGKVVNKLIFGLRDSLNQDVFLECVEGLEKLYEEYTVFPHVY